MQITHQIYQVLGGMYANISNIYVIMAEHSLILVDTAESLLDRQIIEENLQKWHLDQYPVSYVLLTHKHQGHIGNAAYFRSKGAQIIASTEDALAIETGDLDGIVDFSPFPERETYIPCPVDIKVQDGQRLCLDGVEVSVTTCPGHTAGSVVYRIQSEEKTFLFTGDVLNVTQDTRGVTLGWEGGVDFDAQQYWYSLMRLAEEPCDVILPAHGLTAFCHAQALLRKAKTAALLKWRRPTIETE